MLDIQQTKEPPIWITFVFVAVLLIGIFVAFTYIAFLAETNREYKATMTQEQRCHYEYDNTMIRNVSSECFRYFK